MATAVACWAAQPILALMGGYEKMTNILCIDFIDLVSIRMTMQATETIAMYDWLRIFKMWHGKFIPDYGK